MVSPARSSTSRSRRDDAGKFVVGVLSLLGLVASVFLIFSNSLQLVRVGLVIALWAAVIGALAATRYRREAALDQVRAQNLQTVYELQLEREISARREYELSVEERVRREVGADAAELAALRGELAVLRESLQRLFDGDLPNPRPALHADAVRLQELPSPDAANDNSRETDTWDAWNAPAVPLNVTPVFDSDHPEPPAFASPYDDPVTAETAVVSPEQSDPEPESESESVAPKQAPPERLPADESPARPAPERRGPIGTAGSRRRRRAESEDGEDSPGRRLSVAEIMANLRSEQGGR
ncbi:hypothetical protein NDR87_05910 [Nocardia sp. CDC159]|uniref:DUF6779 domain-containing protein n=1 Tax=Nocardia pulmonis TaxID=2951408 RepID=A0A9X2E2P7_9NOCA|nr:MULTISPECIES: DUF6779 domain-containing protein [Nocardia]MCM6772804.1 hypothetical protein [Nocardia pulmonis]MCM6785893.1 hypothetical protein [Nocardia sp. CDC159]